MGEKKRCSSCMEIKNTGDFHKNKAARDGLNNTCRECRALAQQGIQTSKRELNKKSGLQYCRPCGEFLDLSMFYKSNVYCKACLKRWKERRSERLVHACGACGEKKPAGKFVRGKNFPYSVMICLDCESARYFKTKDVEYVRRQRRAQERKRRANHTYRLHCNISRSIRSALKHAQTGKSARTRLLLPYSISDLKAYLEAQFEPWMSWDNYGSAQIGKQTWQIDHIIPQSALRYDSADHPNFKKCWCLDNLRPLESFANIKKSNKSIDKSA